MAYIYILRCENDELYVLRGNCYESVCKMRLGVNKNF